MKSVQTNFESPIGNILIEANDNKITSVQLTKKKAKVDQDNKLTKKVKRVLDRYFKTNNFEVFSEIKPTEISFELGTPFEQKVWHQLHKLKKDQLTTYSDLAKKVNSPKAFRAVGRAVGKNPFLILIPCHRVIGKNKSLTGFSAGIENKKYLLAHEGLLEFVSDK